MQVQCTFEREQVFAVVMHTTALNQWGKKENQLTVRNYSLKVHHILYLTLPTIN